MYKIHRSSTNPLSDVISKLFRMIFNYVESFIEKFYFAQDLKTFWL